MRTLLSSLCLMALLTFAVPAHAQLRQDISKETSQVKLFDSGAGFSLNKFFSPQHFQMSHSLEFSSSSFGGASSSLAMYTNSMQWQFSSKLAARVDIAMAYSPFANSDGPSSITGPSNSNGRIFLRNAEIAYRPKDNMFLHLSVRQSPYGNYMNPYGYSPYGNFYGYNSGWGSGEHAAERLFFRDAGR